MPEAVFMHLKAHKLVQQGCFSIILLKLDDQLSQN